VTKEQEAKQNRVMGIDPIAFAAFQAKQAGAAVALSATESGAGESKVVSLKMAIDEAAFQTWLADQRAKGLSGSMASSLGPRALAPSSGGGSAFLTIPFPRSR
jgi:hypothetical protein